MVIRFRRKSQAEWLTLFILAMPFFFFFFMDLLRFPAMVKYTVDIAWVSLVLIMIANRIQFPNKQSQKLALVVGLLFLSTLFGFALHYQSFFYYLWGIRNNLRFFVFFFACIFFIKEDGLKYYIKFFHVLFWINIPVVLVQYVLMGKVQDNLGGIFGVEKGCNSYMNIFLLIITTYSILRFMSGEEKGLNTVIKCAVSLMIAVWSELKVFMLELMIVVLLATVMSRFSFRKLWVILGVAVGILLAVNLLAQLFPHFANWFNLERIVASSGSQTGYASAEDVNRLTAVPIVWERFLTTWLEKLFGLGLGNCDYAAFDFLTSPFYLSHRNLHYMWFSSSFLVLETGIVGLVLYILFFVAVFFQAGKREKEKQANALYCQLARTMSVLCLFMIVYNGSLRTEAGFMMYFVLALPFIPKAEIAVKEKTIEPMEKVM